MLHVKCTVCHSSFVRKSRKSETFFIVEAEAEDAFFVKIIMEIQIFIHNILFTLLCIKLHMRVLDYYMAHQTECRVHVRLKNIVSPPRNDC